MWRLQVLGVIVVTVGCGRLCQVFCTNFSVAGEHPTCYSFSELAVGAGGSCVVSCLHRFQQKPPEIMKWTSVTSRESDVLWKEASLMCGIPPLPVLRAVAVLVGWIGRREAAWREPVRCTSGCTTPKPTISSIFKVFAVRMLFAPDSKRTLPSYWKKAGKTCSATFTLGYGAKGWWGTNEPPVGHSHRRR